MEKARIPVVEDEAINAMELEGNLKNLGYEVSSLQFNELPKQEILRVR